MTRPVPHIGPSLSKRRAVAHYTQVAEQAKHERAADEVNGLLHRVRQAGTGECAEHGDVSSWRDALIFWIGALSGLIGWALVIAATWLLAPSMTGFGEAFVRVFGGVR